MCGSCAMTVNGRPRWTCRTHVSKVAGDGRLTIGPLQNLPVIKDLATDMQPFFEKWQKAKGTFTPSKLRSDPVEPILPGSPARRAADAAIECINCAVCYAACDTVRWNPDYLGPAALNRAWTLVNDPRDASNAERLAAIAADGGCHACHSHQSCQEYCPLALNPTASIAGLKRRALQAYLSGAIKL
jgi:fumarate reductase iron-sulfur subunit